MGIASSGVGSSPAGWPPWRFRAEGLCHYESYANSSRLERQGRAVRVLDSGESTDGDHERGWTARPRRNRPVAAGIIVLNKPTGPTSRELVNRVARLLPRVKVGHAGTLDPLASGILIVCVGAATRLTTRSST